MKLSSPLAALVLGSVATACNGQPAATAPRPPAKTPVPSTNTARAMPPAASAAPPYTVRGIIDPGLSNLVAFALKIPRGWQLMQSFTRKWNGAQPVNQVSLRLLAPGGQQQIDFLPERPYYYQDGPTSRSLRQQAASMGMALPRRDEYELPPLPALAYIRQVLLPDLARQGLRVQPTGEHASPPQATGPTTSHATAYVDGRLPNGRLVRVECQVNTQVTTASGEQYINWAALPSISQTSGNLNALFAHTTAARKSFSINPAWLRQAQQLAHNGQGANNRITQQEAAAYRAYQDHQKQLYEQVARERGESQDRIAKSRGDLLSGKTQYDNAATGERYRLDDRYNHVYQDRNGALHGSNVPLDASALDWQELQQVELKNY